MTSKNIKQKLTEIQGDIDESMCANWLKEQTKINKQNIEYLNNPINEFNLINIKRTLL